MKTYVLIGISNNKQQTTEQNSNNFQHQLQTALKPKTPIRFSKQSTLP